MVLYVVPQANILQTGLAEGWRWGQSGFGVENEVRDEVSHTGGVKGLQVHMSFGPMVLDGLSLKHLPRMASCWVRP